MFNKKILVFDLGGVIIDLHVDRSFRALAEMGVAPALLTEAGSLVNATMQAYDRGDISTGKFFGYLASFVPQEVRDSMGDRLHDTLCSIWNMMLGDFREAKLKRIKELRQMGFRVVMLSNTNEAHWPEIERKFFAAAGEPLGDCFDALYLSYRMRRRKPEPEIFLELLAAENAVPGDCVFFDDSAENCAAARVLGIEAVQVERNSGWDNLFIDD